MIQVYMHRSGGDSMYRDQTDSYIESKREEMLEDLKALVRINSQRGEAEEGKPFGAGPAAVIAKAQEMMSRYGLRVRNYDNYVVTGDFGPADKELDILAHLDVVPVTEDWTVTAPFEPLIKDGRIYGRGTADDKGPAIAALYAIRSVIDLGLPLKKGVRLILGSDEECGSSDLKYYYGIEKEAPCTFTPDADFPVINLEKARLAKSFTASFDKQETLPALVCLDAGSKVNVVPGSALAKVAGLDREAVCAAAAKEEKATGVSFTVSMEDGICLIQAKGVAAHGSTPEAGNNALTALLALLDKLPLAAGSVKDLIHGLACLYPHGDTEGRTIGVAMQDDKSGALTMNLGILRITDTELYGEFDVRAPLCATDENLTEVVRSRFAEAGITMEAGNMKKAHYVPEDTDFVKTLLASYEHYSGKPGKALYTGGGTYVHELERGVAFGCMSEDVDNHMHGDDEFMEIDTLIMSAKIFADVILKLCGE